MTTTDFAKKPETRSRKAVVIAVLLRIYLAIHVGFVSLLRLISYRRKVGSDGADVLLTGTFYSENWLMAHVKPIGLSAGCRSIWLVMTYEMESFDNVEVIIPPRWLRRLFGDVGARLITFTLVAVWRRPHFVGGFHLLFNGLVASLVARICGARSLYFCVGGPAEVLDGGLLSENRLFEKIELPDKTIESRLLSAVSGIDQIVTMGTSAKEFFRARGIITPTDVISGGIEIPDDLGHFDRRSYDVIFVGRIAPIKRVDVFVETISVLQEKYPNVRAVVIGDGSQRTTIEKLVDSYGLNNSIEFLGFQPSVTEFLLKSKVFVLTSDSEGLSLALMEAMAAGAVPVVSQVGDLGDIVNDGASGRLVAQRTPENFATAISYFLSDPTLWESASSAARLAAENNSVSACSLRWQRLLMNESE